MLLEGSSWSSKQFIDIRDAEYDNYSNDWTTISIVNPSSPKSLEIQGHTYRLIETKERYLPLSSFQRIAKIALATLLTIATLFIALCSQSVRDLFTGRQELFVVKLPLRSALRRPSTTPAPDLAASSGAAATGNRRGSIHFGVQRGREFDDGEAPDQIQEIHSLERVPVKTEDSGPRPRRKMSGCAQQ